MMDIKLDTEVREHKVQNWRAVFRSQNVTALHIGRPPGHEMLVLDLPPDDDPDFTVSWTEGSVIIRRRDS
jgi:hypothetical protein